ncbi:hypothetical protein [Serinibacter salmoneus]|uniref:N-acetyltransferase domain-containing protein n=1 Tax=Serinibacter salmoneus TaxID=556530 RepID=A0A2A9D637_9MICO|nr:hypothetical protein [Serinibacter salmoneus]PFG21309.1 hypothetical protein ATL40_2936 [Serinibacter salmoneus]
MSTQPAPEPTITAAHHTSAAAAVPAVPETTVRRGTLVDVNAVVRLMRAGAAPVDINGDGILDGPHDEETAAAAARLALSHLSLESGDLWVAERGGRLVAASVWLPGDGRALSADTSHLLARELHLDDVSAAIGPGDHLRGEVEATATGVFAELLANRPRLVLASLTVATGEVDPREVIELARRVVHPVVHADESPVLAVAIDDARARLLRAVGFTTVSTVPLGELNAVWVGRAARPAPGRTPIRA